MSPASIILLISLVGIIVMIGRKLAVIDREWTEDGEGQKKNPFLADIEKLKYASRKNIKKYGYLGLFAALRFYIHSTYFLKKKSIELAKKIENKLIRSKKSAVEEIGEKREVNRYLKMISEYQQKIRNMKDRIREEEGVE